MPQQKVPEPSGVFWKNSYCGEGGGGGDSSVGDGFSELDHKDSFVGHNEITVKDTLGKSIMGSTFWKHVMISSDLFSI